MDNILKVNTFVYNFQIELNYWDRYYDNLLEFVTITKLTKSQQQRIHKELVDITSHKKKLADNVEKKLKKTYYWESEKFFNEKFKIRYNTKHKP